MGLLPAINQDSEKAQSFSMNNSSDSLGDDCADCTYIAKSRQIMRLPDLISFVLLLPVNCDNPNVPVPRAQEMKQNDH
jgi:hypothetical protein